MPTVEFTEVAEENIDGIVSWIAERNITAAEQWLAGLFKQCSMLARHPGIGRVRPELSIDFRVFVYRETFIFYDIGDRGILVAYVIDTRQDLPNLSLATTFRPVPEK